MNKLLCVLTALMVSGGALAADQQITLAVPGMNCMTCPITVKKALQQVPGVGEVAVSMETRQAVVQFDDAQAPVAALIAATTNAGYPSSLVSSADESTTGND
ncbi:mercury resistance system periplasmic binding protein MerP [Simiduia aestuariiviva]|uniref:Periplasmic mercury ion-binding protein n=1 Tax=Simiduia aestuariiviva TaxID=1510459 RepID=A0A839UHD3_9GAMM|nr:mercury resistance system periplasmic binding protein MerP [Simiduia aestuariiviva]MBB3167444.1 mercuric ion binding protein [Simiduia aestuariiviva]